MARVSADLRRRFLEYTREAENAKQNLAFLLDNLGYVVDLDCSVESLEEVEKIFWEMDPDSIPPDLSDDEHFASLLGQYFGQCLVAKTGGKWVQSKDSNPLFGQPCIDGFGNEPWDRIYPVDLALHLRELPKKKPEFPGMRKRRVLATILEKALRIHRSASQKA